MGDMWPMYVLSWLPVLPNRECLCGIQGQRLERVGEADAERQGCSSTGLFACLIALRMYRAGGLMHHVTVCICVFVHVCICTTVCGTCCCLQANCYWQAHTDYWSQKVKCTLCSFHSLKAPSFSLTFSPPSFIFYIFFSVILLLFLSPWRVLSLAPSSSPFISDDFSRGVTHWAWSHHVR